MFDLFRSRAKAVRYLLGALLMLVAISMVVTLIPGWGSSGGGQDQVVAEIAGGILSLREVQIQIQAALRAKSFPHEMAALYVPQMIDQMITERALAYEAERLGFRVTEEDVAQAIRAALPQLYQGGKFVGKEFYAEILRQQNMTIPEFEAAFRQQLLLNNLRDMVAQAAIVTPDEVEQEYRRRNDRIKLEYVVISPAKLRSQVSASLEEIKSYFEKNRPLFQIREKRSVELLVIDEDRIGRRIAVPDAELRRSYEVNKDQYRLPERVHARHILLKTTDKPKEEIPKIEARAEELLKQIKGGADFAELARKSSEDPGSASKGGDLGWIARGQTVKAFEDTAFSLSPKATSHVIKTEYGFHILQVLEKQEARVKPFEEVKDEIAKELKRQRVFETMQSLADQARAELIKSPQQAAQTVQRLDLPLLKAEKVAPGDPLPEVGTNPTVAEAIAGLAKGQVTQALQLEGNKLVIAVLTDVFPGRQAELSEVEKEVRERIVNEKLTKRVEERAREVLEKAKASNGDLKKVAKETGLELKSTQEFGPDGAADGIGPASYVYEGFTKDVGSVFGPVESSGDRFICKVAAKIPADPSKLGAQREAIRGDLKAKKARQREELFADSLRTHLIKEGKIKIHEDVIRRLTASYRG